MDTITTPRLMTAAWYERTGAPHDVLVVGEMPVPEIGPGDVLVRVAVSGVNPHDTKKRAGWLGRPMSAPRIVPHADAAGTVAMVGHGVSERRLGERVWVVRADIVRPGSGAAAQYAVVPAKHAFKLPDNVSFEIGASLGVPGMTAHRTVFAEGPVTGQTLLITGGAGAVASYAIQFARWNGARVIATVSSPEKAALARAAGADEVVDYRTQDVAAEVLRLTEGEGVDRIVEVDFGANMEVGHRVIKANGVIAAYSSTRAPEPILPYYAFAAKGVTLHFIQGSLLTDDMRRAAGRDINALLARGMLRHPTPLLLPLTRVADAHAALESGTVTGKVLVASP